jgi:hypothetical protein
MTNKEVTMTTQSTLGPFMTLILTAGGPGKHISIWVPRSSPMLARAGLDCFA